MIESINAWFKEAVPAPSERSLAVQMGVHFEEVAEMLEAVTITRTSGVPHASYALDALEALKGLATALKSGEYAVSKKVDVDLLDAICDQIVTGVGVGYMAGYDSEGALMEVNSSNWSKFVEGQAVFDGNGKIKKGPHYFKPSLEQYVGK